jgi:hypothetical protein
MLGIEDPIIAMDFDLAIGIRGAAEDDRLAREAIERAKRERPRK